MILLVNKVLQMVRATKDHLRAAIAHFLNSYRLTEYGMFITISICILAFNSVLLIYSDGGTLSGVQVLASGIASYMWRLLDVFLAPISETFISGDTGALISLTGVSIGIENTQKPGARPERGPGGGGLLGGK